MGPEGRRHQNGAKDFLLHQRVCGLQAGDQGRGIETAARWQGAGCGEHLAARCSDHVGDACQLFLANDCANVDTFVQGIANTQGFHPRLEFGVEAVGDALLHDQTRPGTADLSLVKEDRVDQALDRAVDICILKYDIWRFATQLER